ncbi:hypothetical protein IPH25_01995 [bacterium]|nr:MAG: hypothetical protein IPG37_04125 [bacterium]QQR62196.1 MAG: hypothetical protein IPH25_01995 [bacterium]QQR63246.1 MAG: hypothetical protein IPH67_02105 [bacterium]
MIKLIVLFLLLLSKQTSASQNEYFAVEYNALTSGVTEDQYKKYYVHYFPLLLTGNPFLQLGINFLLYCFKQEKLKSKILQTYTDRYKSYDSNRFNLWIKTHCTNAFNTNYLLGLNKKKLETGLFLANICRAR